MQSCFITQRYHCQVACLRWIEEHYIMTLITNLMKKNRMKNNTDKTRTKNPLFNLWWNCVTIYLKCLTFLQWTVSVSSCRLYNIIIIFRQLTGSKTFQFFFSLPKVDIACLVMDIYHPNSTIMSSNFTSLQPSAFSVHESFIV